MFRDLPRVQPEQEPEACAGDFPRISRWIPQMVRNLRCPMQLSAVHLGVHNMRMAVVELSVFTILTKLAAAVLTAVRVAARSGSSLNINCTVMVHLTNQDECHFKLLCSLSGWQGLSRNA